MTKEKKIIIGMIIILILLITIFGYFLINKNSTIKKQAEKIELQAMETNGSNSYTTTQDHLKEISQNNRFGEKLTFFEEGRWQNTDILNFKTYNSSINGNNLIIGKTQGSGIYATSSFTDTSYNYIVVECENNTMWCQFGGYSNGGSLPSIISEGTNRVHFCSLESDIYLIPNNQNYPIFWGNSQGGGSTTVTVKRIYACKIR